VVPPWRAWARVAKSAALFVLSFPLVFATLAATIAADAGRLAVTTGALACFWLAGALAWAALSAEARYLVGTRLELPAIPLKLLSAVLTAGGAALAATAGGQTPVGASVLAAVAFAGHICFYGRDLRPRRIEIAPADGVDVTTLRRQIEEGYGRLRRIEATARTLALPELGQRLDRITAIGRGILREVERHPRDATRVRRFLNLYLDDAEKVTAEYARTHRRVPGAALEQTFRQLLIDMETTFAEQHRKLLERDVVSLDADIEVLDTRLKQEIAHLEARR
jgi:5-bromo-4-chloroindolyl phosphate hydrolysis protein